MWRGMWISGVLICLLLPACSSRKPPTPTQNFVAWSQQAAPHKKRLCVLPFENASHVDELDEKVRQGVAGHLSVKRFTDVELHEIDARLTDIADWHRLAPRDLGRRLNCDVLVYGLVSKPDTIYAGVYSQLTLIGTLRVVGVASGDVLLHETYTTRLHDLGLPLSPVGLVASMVRNLRTFTDTRFVRAIDDLSRNLAALVPDLPETGASTSAASQKQDSAMTRPARPVRQSHIYQVQVAAFRSHDEAQRAARLLHREGYAPAIAEVARMKQEWHRVIIGPFSSARSAYETSGQIKEKLPFDPIVTQGPSR